MQRGLASSTIIEAESEMMKGLVRQTLQAGLEALRSFRPPRRFDMERICREHGIETRGLVHLGANDGMEAAVYDRCGFDRVLWVEGYEPFYKRLVEHLKPFPKQQALNVLISDQDGETVQFKIAQNSGVSSTVFSPGAKFFEDFPNVQFATTEPLSARRLDKMFEESAIDLAGYNVLVLDLEGSELKALRSLGQYLGGFGWVGIEISVTENFVTGPQLRDVDEFLASGGFKRVETIMGSSSGDAIYRRTMIRPMDRLSMKLSEVFYSYGYYRFYRDYVVKGLKRFLAD